jgi:hypothetical protein
MQFTLISHSIFTKTNSYRKMQLTLHPDYELQWSDIRVL